MMTRSEIPPFVSVGKYSSIAKLCVFHPLSDEHQCSINHKCVHTNNWNQAEGGGTIVIGNDVWLGEGVRVLNGVTIGDGAVVGAGAVVAKSIPPYSVAVGNPATVVRYRFNKTVIKRLLELKWWYRSDDEVRAMIPEMLDVDSFLSKYEKRIP